MVESLRGVRATNLACGQYHTCVATAGGAVLSCGKNDYGQLGVDSAEGQRTLVAVPLKGSDPSSALVEVRCGYYHTVALKGDSVFGWGRNDYGQLGLGHATQRVFGPQVVQDLEGKGIASLAAGCYHTLAVGFDGTLWVFGRNNHGQ